jgi:hypothetical protein
MEQTLESIFQEYTRLRLNGLDANEAVMTLKPYLAPLDAASRDELAQLLRAWENRRTEKISQKDRARLLAAAKARKAENTIACPVCERPNVSEEVICYACGSLLHPETKFGRTNILPPKTGELQNDAFFGNEMSLCLMPESEGESILLQPQLASRELTIGRSEKGDTASIDIDLAPLNAVQHGVSRIHASLRYDTNGETISILDLGSTNGTYLNEQRLHGNERRVIRNGDTIRFARLGLRVVYRSKG